MKKHIVMLGLLILICLSGCIKGTSLNESHTVIGPDGTVDEIIIEDFDKDYYELEELKALILSEIETFDGNKGAIELKEIKETEGQVYLKYHFSSIDAYNDFFNTYLVQTTWEVLEDSEPSYLEHLKSVGEMETKESQNDNYRVVLYEGINQFIQVKGNVIYISENCKSIGYDTVKVNDYEKAVIVYKPSSAFPSLGIILAFVLFLMFIGSIIYMRKKKIGND